MSRSSILRVYLTPEERAEAVAHGHRIYERSREQGLSTEKLGSNDFTTLEASILGALGEMAVAKALRVAWPKHIGNFKGADLPHNIEVRQLSYDNYCVRVYRGDDNSRRVVGVIIPPDHGDGHYLVVGWIVAGHAKRPEWWKDPNEKGLPLFLVPLPHLNSMQALVSLIDAEKKAASAALASALPLLTHDSHPLPASHHDW